MSVVGVAVILVSLAGNAFAAALTSVPAEEYVEDYCAAVAKYAADEDVEDAQTTAAVDRLEAAVDASNDEWTPELAAATRDAIVVALPRYVELLDTLIADSEAAGAPDVPHGDEFAQTIIRFTEKLRDFEAAQLERARAIRIDSEIGFAVDLRRWKAKAKALDVGKLAKREHLITDAPKALRRVVVYWTTNRSTCPR